MTFNFSKRFNSGCITNYIFKSENMNYKRFLVTEKKTQQQRSTDLMALTERAVMN